jgi:hypothetical protein
MLELGCLPTVVGDNFNSAGPSSRLRTVLVPVLLVLLVLLVVLLPPLVVLVL